MVENQTFSVDELFEQESDKMAARNEEQISPTGQATKILPEISKQMCGLKAGKVIELKIC